MGDEPPQQAVESNSDAQNKKTECKNLKGIHTKREVGQRVISGTFGTFGVIVAYSVHNWGFWVFGIPGLLCLAICLRLELKHHGYTKNRSRAWAAILFATGLIAATVYWQAREPAHVEVFPEKPHFSFFLDLTPSRTAKTTGLWLTNDFLLFNDLPELKSIDQTNCVGVLVVPIASSQERIALTFIAVNGSSSTAYCESFQISAINVDSLHCSGGAGWVPEHPLTETEKLLDCEVTWKMRPRDSYSLPPLHFENLSNGVIGVFSLSARAQGYGNSLCGFRIIFTTEPGVVPHITKGEFIKEGASDMFRVAFPQVFSDDRWSRQADLIPFE